MPDLSKSTVTTWLEEREPAVAVLWGGAVRPIEDDADVRAALADLGETLDLSLNRDAQSLSARLCETPTQICFRSVLAQLGPARLLRLLEWLTFAGLPDGEKVVAGLLQDEPGAAGTLVRRALLELHRQALLVRLFQRDRLKVLLAACQAQNAEAA